MDLPRNLNPDSAATVSRKRLIHRFCRLCLREFPFLLPFKATLNGTTLAGMLERLLGGFQVAQTHDLPDHICSRCLAKLDFAYHVQLELVRNEHRLKHFLQSGQLVQQLFDFQNNHSAVRRESQADKLLALHGTTLLGEKVVVSEGKEVPGMQLAELEAAKLYKPEPPSCTTPCDHETTETTETTPHPYSRLPAGSLQLPKRTLRNRQTLREAIKRGSTGGMKTMPIDMTKCYICETTTASETDLRDHIASHVDLLPHSCPRCSKETEEVKPITSLVTLLRHYRMHSYPLKCPNCPQRFLRYGSVYAHVRYRHELFDNPEGYTCEVCGLTIKYRPTFMYHMRNHYHEQMGTFRCSFCDRPFGTKARLERHERSHTGERPFACRLCPKTFAHPGQLTVHRSRHINERGHRCIECGKAFYTRTLLKQHQLSHDREAGKSQDAEKRSARSEPRPCTYPGCQHVGATYQAYYLHRLRHIMAHECEECGRRFARLSELHRHQRIYHSTEHPYRCDQCDKVFLSRQTYREHMDAHANIRRYACEICDKKFVRRRNLLNHQKAHTNQRPFKCELCESAFKYKSDYNRHQRDRHRVEPPAVDEEEREEEPRDFGSASVSNIVLIADHSMDKGEILRKALEQQILVEDDLQGQVSYIGEEDVTKYEEIETVEESIVFEQPVGSLEIEDEPKREYIIEYIQQN